MWPEIPTAVQLDRLTVLNDAYYPGTPDFSVLKLYQNDVSPDANSVAASFTEADFTGYADVNLTMTASALNDSNIPVSQSNLCHFQPSATTVTNTIYGIFIVDSLGNLIAAQRFATPQPMTLVTHAINGVWRTSEPASNYGWLSVE